MTIIQPNSISGVTSITAQGGGINFYRADGTGGDLTINNIVGAAATFTGVLTYEDVANIDSVGVITARTDINLGDSIIHVGDTDTKIKFPSANEISFETAGSERVRINSTGNMGLGVASPNVLNEPAKFQELTLGGKTEGAAITLKDTDGNVQGGLFTSDATGAMIVRTITNHFMQFRTNNTERVRIDTSGRLLIGAGAIATPKSSGAGGLDLDSGLISLVIGGNENSTGRTDGTSKINRIAAPHRTNSQEPVAMISCQASTSTNNLFYGGGSGYTNAVTEHKFYTAADSTTTTGTERFRIDSNGYVNIGSAAPRKRLDITGPDGRSGASPGNSDTALVIDNDGGNGAIMEFLSDNNAYGRIFFTDTDASNRGQIVYEHGGDAFQFSTAGSERLRIDSTGHLGLNVASGTQLANSLMLTLRPDNGDGIRIIRPGDSNNSPNVHLDLTTTTSGSSLRSGGEAYTTKYRTNNCDMLFNSYLSGGTGGIIRLMTSDGSSGTTRYWQMDEKGMTTHRSRSTSAKTHEFSYTGGAGGGSMNVNLLSISGYAASSTAFVEIKYVGMYGLADAYISQGIWLCSYRRSNGGSAANALAQQTHNGGSSGSSNVSMAWVGDNLRLSVGAYTGFTVHVTATVYNATINVLV